MKQERAADLERTDLLRSIGDDRLFPTSPTAVEAFRDWQAGQQR